MFQSDTDFAQTQTQNSDFLEKLSSRLETVKSRLNTKYKSKRVQSVQSQKSVSASVVCIAHCASLVTFNVVSDVYICTSIESN